MFRDLDDMRRSFDEGFSTPLLPAIWRRLPAEEREWNPAVEVYEKEDRFVVKAELPGLTDEDVDISVTDGALTVKGEKRTEHEVKEDEYHWSERTYGTFLRTVALPTNVDAEKIGATFDNGILEISLPKVAEVQPKKITISAKKKAEKPGK
jgi:HSP20 family protein